ncbi:MAG TPA: TetR/AcrR family transcriptional regulator [Thermoanaerobaculia bacterium]|nr:TetR/AcrR family transcriptional regulator [Thermoanaerobaculia bacterium]
MLAKKREILRAAAEVFRRQGLHATGMRDIAAAAGMAVGNLYYYFADKQALLAFCQEDALAGLLDLAARVGGEALPADQRLWLLVVGHMLRLHDATPGAIAHLDVDGLATAARDAVLAQRDAYEESFREVVRQGASEGLFRRVDPKLAALTMLGALNWTAQWYRPGGGRTARQLGEEMADLLVRGLLADGKRLRRPPFPDDLVPIENGGAAS